jgi:hypothetical protein
LIAGAVKAPFVVFPSSLLLPYVKIADAAAMVIAVWTVRLLFG